MSEKNMSDLIERLSGAYSTVFERSLAREAADEIERLTTALSHSPEGEIEKLQGCIQGWIEANAPGGWINELRQYRATAIRKLDRYESAFGNLQTLCGNNIDGDNLEAKVMAIVDNARSGR